MNWNELQKQYIESLNSYFTAPNKSQNPWQQAMDYWWQSNSVSMPMDQMNVFNKVMNQGKSFYFLGEQLSNLLELLSSQKKTKKNWQTTLEQQIELMKQAYDDQSINYHEGLLSEWNTSEEAWKSLINFIPGIDGLLDKNISDSDMNDYIEKYLSMPGLGLNREIQEKIQHTLLSYKNFQEVNANYNQAMSQVASSGLDLLKEKLIKLAESNEKIESLRAVYDLWVDCNEEVYGEYVLGSEYSGLYGELVNSLMTFKKDITDLMNEVYSSYNMTSKNDFDDIVKKQHQLKQKLKKAEQQNLKEQQRIDALEKEIIELREALVDKKTTTSTAGTAKRKKTKQKSSNVEAKKKTSGARSKKRVVKKKTTRAKTTASNNTDSVIEIKF